MTITAKQGATNTDLECIRGDTTQWTLAITRDDVKVDLTSAKLWFTGRRGQGGAVVFQRTSEASEGIVIDADQVTNKGVAVVKLASDSTSDLASEVVTLYYDIQCKIGTDIWTVYYGDLVVTPDATSEIS